jgi:outer membrane protein OmpA-like peptidoglycan-associated protein
MSQEDELFSPQSHSTDEEQWISLSDLMTGLMMIFMLIAIAFMMKVEVQQFKTKQVAVLYDQVRLELYSELMQEFSKDLPVWHAELTQDLVFRFKDPEILFNTGKDDLKPKFQDILHNFFPRYMRIISADKYEEQIKEVRIEGHTSSFWAANTAPEEAYFKNMELSQSRTRSTLRFVLGLPEVQTKTDWLHQHVTANGLSSSHLIVDKNGMEDPVRSQRVEFHIRTDAENWIASILETLKK